MIHRLKQLARVWLLRRWTEAPDPYDHPQITVGRHTYGLGSFTVRLFRPDDFVQIGAFCSLSPRVVIVASGEHYTDRVSTFPFEAMLSRHGNDRDVRPGSVIIENDVWVGTGAIIMSGARLRNGCVVGAGAVVRGEVAPYAVVGGVPARVLRNRFDEATREKMLEIAWWTWPDEVIRERQEDFYLPPESFIARHWRSSR
jgi:acetyltransferase-like isoleucine patch superfamily enzyme